MMVRKEVFTIQKRYLPFIAMLVAFGISGCGEKVVTNADDERDYLSWNHLINPEDAEALVGKEGYLFIDLRDSETYGYGCIPGAVNLPISSLIDSLPQRNEVFPKALELERILVDLGLSNSDTIIAYDDKGGINAAHLWWLLKYYGWNQVKILNGGTRAWRHSSGSWSKELVRSIPGDFKIGTEQYVEFRAEISDIQPNLYDGEYLILDLRPLDQYVGTKNSENALWEGRIQSAKWIDIDKFIQYEGDKRIIPVTEMDGLVFGELLLKDLNQSIVVYSNEGIRSSFMTFVFTELAGCTSVKNYDRGWSHWTHHHDQSPANLNFKN